MSRRILPILAVCGLALSACAGSSAGAGPATEVGESYSFTLSLVAMSEGVILERVSWSGAVDPVASVAELRHHHEADPDTWTDTQYLVAGVVAEREIRSEASRQAPAWVRVDPDEELTELVEPLTRTETFWDALGTEAPPPADAGLHGGPVHRRLEASGLEPSTKWFEKMVAELVQPANAVWTIDTYEDESGYLVRADVRLYEPPASTGGAEREQRLHLSFVDQGLDVTVAIPADI